MDIILIAFLGYMLGCVGRTFYDYLWKILEKPDLTFDTKYIVSMIISIILSFLMAMVTFTSLTMPVDGAITAFFLAFTSGFTINHLVNKGVSYLSEAGRK